MQSDIIDAISFNSLIKHGVSSGGNVVNGMPWSFEYKGVPITHENDRCYIIGDLGRMAPGDALITMRDNTLRIFTWK